MEKSGHEITVLTGKPNYPDGNVFPGYKVSGIQKETYGQNVEVMRVPLRPRGKGGGVNLALNYLSYVFTGTFFGPWLLRKKKFDVVFIFAVSPITVALPAIVINLFKRAKLAIWVQDLWPQSLVVTGFVKNKWVLKAVEVMVRFIYSCCDVVLVQSKSFFEPVREIYPKANLVYYPNSFRDVRGQVLAELPASILEILADNFCVVFAGNIGKAQSVETIVNAAKLLIDIPDLKVVFVGSGSMLSWIEDEKQKGHLPNVECVGRFDISFMPAIYAKSKALLLTLNAGDILQYTLPWKTQSYMAAGKPIIGAIDGEGTRVIREAECGFVGPAENSEILAANIRKAYDLDSDDLKEMGIKGQKYFAENFEMTSQSRKLVEIFETIRH